MKGLLPTEVSSLSCIFVVQTKKYQLLGKDTTKNLIVQGEILF